MFDLHSHILPRLDDGAKDDQTALAMLEIAAADGTQGIVATPHVIEGDWLPAWETISEGCRRLGRLAAAGGIEIAIHPGAEVAVSYDLLALLTKPGPYCLNSGRYILLELPASQVPAYADEFFFTLQARGFCPILAHPERNQELMRQPERLAEWLGKGLLVQVNAGSLTGQLGERVMRFAEQLVSRRMIHCIGSDAHGIRSRRPSLVQAINKLAVLAGAAAAEEIAVVNPGKILRGEEVQPPEILYEAAKETLISRIARALRLQGPAADA